MRARIRRAGRRAFRLLPVAIASAAVAVLVWNNVVPGRRVLKAPSAVADVSCVQVAREFADYPLVFLGAEYDGLPLTGCQRTRTPIKYDPSGAIYMPAVDFFTFVYGTCTPKPDAGCPPPVQVIVDPPCGPSLEPSMTKEQIKIRDKDVYVKDDGSIRLEGDDVKATIYALGGGYDVSKNKAVDVANALRGANDLASALSPGASLDAKLKKGKVCE